MKAKVYKTCQALDCKLECMGEFGFEKRNTDVVESFDKSADVEQNIINIHPFIEYHTFLGFGGAFTETSAISWSKMSEEKRKEFVKCIHDSAYHIFFIRHCRNYKHKYKR